MNIMWFIFCFRTQMVWTSTTSSLKNLMRWRPSSVQIKLRMDFSVRNSTCTVFFQNFCLLHKCLRHRFVLFFTASLKRRHIRPLHRQSLSELMNGPIRQKLGVIPKNVTWGGNYSFYDLQRYFCVKTTTDSNKSKHNLFLQDKLKMCLSAWQEISWSLWWTLWISFWLQVSMSPSTMASWISSWTQWVRTSTISKHFRMATLDQQILD